MFKPHDWLDRVFEIGIIAKGLNGAVELLGGLLLLFVTPDWIRHLAVSLTRVELSEDPHDFIATHLLHTTNGLTGNAVLFGSVYLLTHGGVKVVLVVALLLNKLWAYPWAIVVLLLFIAYQLYRISFDPTAGLTALTIFDVVIVLLTWREFRVQRRTETSSGRIRGRRSTDDAPLRAALADRDDPSLPKHSQCRDRWRRARCLGPSGRRGVPFRVRPVGQYGRRHGV
jgi:uncharacterized membrane protein